MITVAVTAFVVGFVISLGLLFAISRFAAKAPPLATRWVIRGRTVEVFRVVSGVVYVLHDDGSQGSFPLDYFEAAAKRAEEAP